MKRPDVRLAWREKLTICFMIFGFCGIVLFYIIFFGKILCPNMDKVWNTAELGGHNDQANFWVAVSGEVYDITKFWRGDHSSVSSAPVTQTDMLQLAGYELTRFFPVPLVTGCSGLVSDGNLALTPANFSSSIPNAIHTSGVQSTLPGALKSESWFPNVFLPAMEQYKKGPFVWGKSDITNQANQDGK